MKESHLPIPMFFMHIPKTAGTSFRRMLWTLFDEKNILPNQYDLKNNKGLYPSLEEANVKWGSRLDDIYLLAGHYRYGSSDILPKKAKYLLTFLRDPVERAFSLVKHLQRTNPEYKKFSLEDIISKNKNILQNGQLVYFLNRDEEKNLKIDQKTRIACHRLEQFDFIGITEKFEDSIEWLENDLKYKFPKKLYLNTSEQQQIFTEEEKIKAQLLELNKADQVIYDYGVKLLHERK